MAVVDPEKMHDVGTFAQVHTVVPHEQGAQLLLLGHRRLRKTGVVSVDPLRCSVMHLKDNPYDPNDDMLKATTMELISTLKELLHMHPLYNEQMRNFIQFGADFHDPSRLADLAASLTSGDANALQLVLEELSVPERTEQALLLLRKEANLVKLQQDIGKRVEEKISKDQRRYFLMEQLKSIKKELGIEKDDKTALVQKFRERIEPNKDLIPQVAMKVIEEEITKLEALEPSSSEFSVTRNYLDWLTVLPWGKSGKERLDVEAAKSVLDEDHYGLSDVKERILEFIAVGKLRGSTQGKILCFVGPPGVGKTSIGRSIARALDRAYYRFSVGGLSDVAEIKGHRRTYVGAMPGKMVQCLKATSTSNPFVLIDEIDKLGRGYQGDPASALLELLDPEQNNSFLDHYLDVPVDLSKVLFVCTANQLDTIPGPLLDRMEVIQVSGYTGDEKISIARTYLEPQACLDAGIPKGAVKLEDDALKELVDDYAREAGVRSLKKLIEKVYRKAAFKLVNGNMIESKAFKESEKVHDTSSEGSDEQSKSMIPESNNPNTQFDSSEHQYEEPLLIVKKDDLKDYVGHPPYPSDKIYRNETPLGVVTGLAWTSSGGATLYIEAASIEKGEGKGSLKATGQLGDVMRESSTIAHTYARKFLEDKIKDDAFFANHALHVHVPAGATPKDGPSAGCALVTALLSLAMGKPVLPELAMTGEITLTGKVLPIGGVKEKALAAKRSEIKHVIFPEGNKRDWEDLTEDVKEGLTPHFVQDYDEVFKIAFE
jgi:Lon-like ATP-dependent protease